jgi:hypothetical protein
MRSTKLIAHFTAASLGACCASSAIAASCTGPFRFYGPTASAQGTTKRDQPCSIVYGGRSDIIGYNVVQPPRFGVLGSAGHSGGRLLTAYKPNPGYMGTDEFAVSVEYAPRSTHVAKSTVFHVQLTIGP